jgi:Holliday junction resolvase RusA-like endonuclease
MTHTKEHRMLVDSTQRYINTFIEGVPYCQNKVRGQLTGASTWSQTVIAQTKDLPKVCSKCEADITFILPLDKYPTDHPDGPDLDNLVKRLFDALNKTIFADVKGNDGAVVKLSVSKEKASTGGRYGCSLIIREI